jgi:hypothetical protein
MVAIPVVEKAEPEGRARRQSQRTNDNRDKASYANR